MATASRTARTPITLTPSPAFTCMMGYRTCVQGQVLYRCFGHYSHHTFSENHPLCCFHRTHHVHDGDVSIGIHHSVGWVGHRQEEGEGCAQGGRNQDVQRVDVYGLSLKQEKSCINISIISETIITYTVVSFMLHSSFTAAEKRLKRKTACIGWAKRLYCI